MRKVIVFTLLLSSITSAVFSEEPHKLGKIVVTPSRLSPDLTEVSRSVEVLDADALDYSTYSAIPDAIGNVSNIDIRRRGPSGVQADVSIRGTTFEQNTVLIDGVKVNDPQTGHFNMDLPITMADVDRVEILKGPASSLYGPNAFGGVINIITKKPDDRKVVLSSTGGSHDYFQGGISANYPLGELIKNRFSFEESRSTGYMPETEFNIISLADYLSMVTGAGTYDFLFGYLKKDFGADSFYSNLFSNEDEHTDTRFFKISSALESGNLKIEPKLFLRRHKDKFALDRNRPGWQTNYHTTYNYGTEMNFSLENPFLDTAYGFEVSRDTIDSTSLQTHTRTKDGIYFELSPHMVDDLHVNIGMRADYFSGFGWENSPSINVSYPMPRGFVLRALVGRAYRIPTFTDLFYNDSGNIGNPNLRPESSWTYEAGMDYNKGPMSLAATFFHRDSYDTIDWTRLTAKEPWRASNIGSVSTNGFESSFQFFPKKIDRAFPIEKVFVSHTALDNYAKHDRLSKYALDYLKQHITGGIEYNIFGFNNAWVLNYKKRIGDSGFMVVDTKISKYIFQKDKVTLEAFFDISNLFDIAYSEQSDIPMPGRWVKAGVKFEF